MYCFASPANVSMMASTTSPAKALRVLCLHGYCQNAAVFKNKIGSLRKVLRRDANVELVFVDAPHTAQTELLDSKEDRINSREKKSAEQDIVVAKNLNGEDAKRAWWLSSDGGRAYNGFHTTIDYLNNIFMEQGPFDGILGFSQGAILVHIMCALAAGRRPEAGPTRDSEVKEDVETSNVLSKPAAENPLFQNLQFAVMISGFPTRALSHGSLLSQPREASLSSRTNDVGQRLNGDALGLPATDARDPLEIPSMHIWGTADEMVPPRASKILANQFADDGKVVYTHEKGHIMPVHSEARRALTAFFRRF